MTNTSLSLIKSLHCLNLAIFTFANFAASVFNLYLLALLHQTIPKPTGMALTVIWSIATGM